MKHFDVIRWDCFACPETFPRSEFLWQHVYFEHYEGRFECNEPDCSYAGRNRSTVIAHYREMHMSPNVKGSSFNRPNWSSDQKTSSGTAPHFRRSISAEGEKRCSGTESEDSSYCAALNSCKYTITSVKCTEAGCQRFFLHTEDIDEHMRVVHNMLPFACLVANCSETFHERFVYFLIHIHI